MEGEQTKLGSSFLKKGHPIAYVIGAALMICILYIFSNRMEERFIFGTELMSLLYDIAISTIAAGIFYYFQVYIPEKKKRKVVKENFRKYWWQTKESIIDTLLIIDGNFSPSLSKKLCNFHEFRIYFNDKHDRKEGQTRWDGVWNGLSEDHINDIVIEFEGLIREIEFLLNKVELHNNEIFEFLKRLQNVLYYNKKFSLEHGDEKQLLSLLWGILASSSIIEGPINYDLIDQMIDKI